MKVTIIVSHPFRFSAPFAVRALPAPIAQFAAMALCAAIALGAVEARADEIAWHPWSDAVFVQAKREHKFVLLDLQAVWCHWCHVMDETTYHDPAIISLMNGTYIAVKVDQDARPDLANRYEDYGWPATVIYSPDGTEIVRKQGYIPPDGMARLLREVVADPSPVAYRDSRPEPPMATETVLAAGRRAALREQWIGGYDDKGGGWGFTQKFLDWDSVELALRDAARGDAAAARRARETLTLQLHLLDPAWGGIYQYSIGGGWTEPHFEKIMTMQSENLRIYARAYAQWGDPVYLKTARAIQHYLETFLTSPEGAFYTSQDADLVPGQSSAAYFAGDDRARRSFGVPRVDRHVYSRENGWAASALVELAGVTGDRGAGNDAETAVRWVIDHRALPGGGFSHDERDAAGPYLGDTLSMGRAFLALHELTGDPAWLSRAASAGDFIRSHFSRGQGGGFASSDTTRPSFPLPRPEFDENTAVVRFTVALSAATGRADFRDMAATAMRWLLAGGGPESHGFYVAGLLLAEEEARTDALHIAIVGDDDDSASIALFTTALHVATAHRLIERWDRAKGPAPRGEDIYPDLPKAAAFVCGHGTCSAPIYAASALKSRLDALEGMPP